MAPGAIFSDPAAFGLTNVSDAALSVAGSDSGAGR
jgi:hypothetical protein